MATAELTNSVDFTNTVKEFVRMGMSEAKAFEGAIEIYKNMNDADFSAPGQISLSKVSAKEIADLLSVGTSCGFSLSSKKCTTWSPIAHEVLTTVRDKSNGFQSDVAKKGIEFGRLSEKQSWSVAYEYIRVR
ncbi:hypothetical protein Barb6_03706 [Bacteroidales bacterium Barb6]|nr:hypothetical protein Barb6_03706 [Bacteroidales bacterium Barb6]